MSSQRKLVLPPAPSGEKGIVQCWAEPVVIPTYCPMPPEKNPMFLESRVYQGSSGSVYPLPFIERIAREPVAKEWQAIHLENDYLRVMILPELGGRIHVGLDKTNGYDFFYRQNVIKPALVGLAGPWISGGVEFNWPQHHRPGTYMPVEVVREAGADGSITAWCGDHDPLDRLQGTHGICLHPSKSHIELKVRLYNRTPLRQTFLWWANMAVQVHERYQSFFAPDVHYVADHAKRATSTFPRCEGIYYGINYGTRAAEGVRAEELPTRFVPPGDYPPNDLSWYANIPVPTSYMALHSEGDFFGGYDHRREAGLVHVANHHIAPGKKQWTWGNGEFGYAWDRNLTDEDGPYVELMAGVYTDNQPDFSFLAPGEVKTFSQYWYPIQRMGVPTKANRQAALRVEVAADLRVVRLALCVTEEYQDALLSLEWQWAGSETRCVGRWTTRLRPGQAFQVEAELPSEMRREDLRVTLRDSEGDEILSYRSDEFAGKGGAAPEPATEPGQPSEIATIEELNLIGQHLAQYRHATRSPVPYWQEAIRRDPGDSRANHALGVWHLRGGEFQLAEGYFRTSIERLTACNPNPTQGDASYHLGLTLRYQGRRKEAYDSLYKAAWNYATRSCAYHALAELDAANGDLATALDHLTLSLRTNADNANARNLGVVIFRKMGREAEARSWLEQNLALDPTGQWARYLDRGTRPANNQMALDLAFDYARAGLDLEACGVLETADLRAADGSVPMICYALGYLYSNRDDERAVTRWLTKASEAAPNLCFPSRLEEMSILAWAADREGLDARAQYYMGNLLYDRRRYGEAIERWETSLSIDPGCATAWRNLGIAYFNVLKDAARALNAYEAAFQIDRGDARVFYERDQLWKRTGERPARRLEELQAHGELIELRDDVSIELAAVFNQEGQHREAQSVLLSRTFQPWEGGEGLAIAQHVRTHVALGRRALVEGDAAAAQVLFAAALGSPANLGEAKHPLANQANIFYWMGEASERLGDRSGAHRMWTRAAEPHGDFQEMSVRRFSEMSYYRSVALGKLGRTAECEESLDSLLAYAEDLERTVPVIDYFATSLPAMLLFEEDLERKNRLQARFLKAQAKAGLGEERESAALLRELLEEDPNHALAADFLAEIDCSRRLSETAGVGSGTVQ